jgi:prepilin signal peptidase PulO-like enzyme (type II secretory pathway)
MEKLINPFEPYSVALNLFSQNHPFALLFLLLILGCCVGSFLNVVALRSLKEESLIWPSSYCPQCNHALAPWDNIPVISYLSLGGKCRYCQKEISWQYPLVEIITGLVFLALGYIYLVQPVHVLGLLRTDLIPSQPSETHDLFQAMHQYQETFKQAKTAIQFGSNSADLNSADFFMEKIGLFIGFVVFACTLISVTVTDFREKLIPHEITYPSMIFGIAFSAFVRHDLIGAMAGIGASYIIFDFLAFYGLKLYMMSRRSEEEEDEQPAASEMASESAQSASTTPMGQTELLNSTKNLDAADLNLQSNEEQLRLAEHKLAEPISKPAEVKNNISEQLNPQENYAKDFRDLDVTEIRAHLADAKKTEGEPATTAIEGAKEGQTEDIEVMGGGDAVLSAVMSAYLGWHCLLLSLIIGFLSGTLMGLILLSFEMKKANLLPEAGKKALQWGLILGLAFGAVMGALTFMMFSTMSGSSPNVVNSALQVALNSSILGATGGALLGLVRVGSRVSKPFPFGPALALGGFISMFLIPYWLPFY